jgi:hypothetical protein
MSFKILANVVNDILNVEFQILCPNELTILKNERFTFAMMINNEEKEPFVNPIDKDKVAENPGFLPYAHTMGGAVIRPDDKGKVKGMAVTAMRQQTDMQMAQIYQQMELLATQAKSLQDRKLVSEKIYEANLGFQPIINKVYHVYEKHDGGTTLSLVGPEEWGKKLPYLRFIATVRLLADHTWDVLSSGNTH